MYRISREKQKLIIHSLLEGCSIRSTERLSGCHRDTVMRFMLRTAEHCERLTDEIIRGVEPKVLITCDEVWSYVAKKDKRLAGAEKFNPEIGSQYVFVGMDTVSKLILSHDVGKRTIEVATRFLWPLRKRTEGRLELVTDGFEGYIPAVAEVFGSRNIDYAQLIKVLTNGHTPVREGYAPADRFVRCDRVHIYGYIDPQRISTSLIERQNATVRLFVKRLNRLTLAFSKRLANLKAALTLHFFWYNFGRCHRTLGMTPAIAAGVERRFWEVEDLLPDW